MCILVILTHDVAETVTINIMSICKERFLILKVIASSIFSQKSFRAWRLSCVYRDSTHLLYGHPSKSSTMHLSRLDQLFCAMRPLTSDLHTHLRTYLGMQAQTS